MTASKSIPGLLCAVLLASSGLAWADGPAKISVAAPVEGGQLSIDGKSIGPLPVAGLELEAGRHEIVVTKDGHSTFRKWVIARPGAVTEVVAVLVPITRTDPTPHTEAPKPAENPVSTAVSEAPKDKPVYQKWWFWTAIGTAVVAGTVVAVVVASGGDDFVPTGELGRTSLSDWNQP